MRLIDRDALLEIIRTHCRDLWEEVWNFFDGKPHRSRDYLRGLENGYWEIKKDIEQLPTIDPVKHGRWIGIDDYPYETWECDQCGCIYEEMPSWTPNYCPNCGARMDEVKE